jgi:hypothetical protein
LAYYTIANDSVRYPYKELWIEVLPRTGSNSQKLIEAIAKTTVPAPPMEEATVETPALPDGSLTNQPVFSTEKENVSLFTDAV